MIDPNLFTVEALLQYLLDNQHGNLNKWLELVEIVHKPLYLPQCTVRCQTLSGNTYLRYSQGPRQGYFWDVYGDDFKQPVLALMAVLQAPVPPQLLDKSVWQKS